MFNISNYLGEMVENTKAGKNIWYVPIISIYLGISQTQIRREKVLDLLIFIEKNGITDELQNEINEWLAKYPLDYYIAKAHWDSYKTQQILKYNL
jgi:hypothetical protein